MKSDTTPHPASREPDFLMLPPIAEDADSSYPVNYGRLHRLQAKHMRMRTVNHGETMTEYNRVGLSLTGLQLLRLINRGRVSG